MKWSPIAAIALVYMFILELGSLAAFASWGFGLNIWAAVGTPLVVFVLWSLFLAPKASIPFVPLRVRTILKFVVFALASAALYENGQPLLALIMLVTSLIDVAVIMRMRLDIEIQSGHL